MSLLEEYLQAQFPAPRQIAGVALKPFCLGHAMLLERRQSPFRPGAQGPAGIGDCLFALWICSRPATEANRQINSRQCIWWMRWQTWRTRKLESKELIAAIRAYITEGSEGPRYEVLLPGETTPGAPLLLLFLKNLMIEWRCDELTALNTPLRLVKWRYCTHYESTGSLLIKSTEEVNAKWQHFYKLFPNSVPISLEMYQAIKLRKKRSASEMETSAPSSADSAHGL